MKVGVVGAAGFMGGVLVRAIENHPRLELSMICGAGSAGKRLRDVRPSLDIDMVISAADPDALAENCEVVFLALPHGDSAPLAQQLLERNVRVIDLGSDFRIRDREASEYWHQREAPPEELLSRAFYAQPELRPAPTDAQLIACPGCFATSLMLGLAPLAPHAERVACFGVTGSSGSGISPSPRVHHSFRTTNFIAYKALDHQHLGEVEQLLADIDRSVEFDFIPHSAPMVRGIHTTLLADADTAEVWAELQSLYSDKPAVTLMEGPVPMGAVIGSNRVMIGMEGDETRTVVYVAIDNLLKGGSGQAIQILNQLNSWPETEGLLMNGMWP